MPQTPQTHAVPLVLTPDERTRLERWARGRRTPARLVRRARIVLHAAAGFSNAAIARALGTDRECVGRWRARFAADRLAGIQHEAPRSGRPPVIPDWRLQAIVTQTTITPPPTGTHWSVRGVARAVRVSATTVYRVWEAMGLRPDWARPFALRPASRVLGGLTEVVGGYLTCRDSALVVAGDATWPHRPTHPEVTKGRRRRRVGPTRPAVGRPARYAELILPLGVVIGHTMGLTRHRDWLAFLARLAARVPRGRWVHVVADNPATHQHPEVQRWVEKHPRVQLHFVPPRGRLPGWLVPALQGWVDDRFFPRRKTVGTLREAVEALCPRRRRGKPVAAWTDSRALMAYVTGNPHWYLPPPGMRLENGRLVPACISKTTRRRLSATRPSRVGHSSFGKTVRRKRW